MTTTWNGVGRNRGFQFTLLIETPGAGGKLSVRSPLGQLLTIAVSPGVVQAIVFLLEKFELDLLRPSITSEHKGRRQVPTIAKSIHKTKNYVSKNAGNVNREILDAAWSDVNFAREASFLPELFGIIKKGSDRGHRLNVDVAIEYLGTPPAAPPDSSPQSPDGSPPSPDGSPPSPDGSPPSPDASHAADASANGCEPPSPNADIAPAKLERVSEIPPPLMRPAQIDEKSWANGHIDRTNDRKRDDNSGQTPA